MAWEVALLTTPTPLLFCATGPTPPFDGTRFPCPLQPKSVSCDPPCPVSSLFSCCFVSSVSSVRRVLVSITIASIPLTRALLLASPSLVGPHALTLVCLIPPTSPLNHRRSSSCKDNHLFLPYHSVSLFSVTMKQHAPVIFLVTIHTVPLLAGFGPQACTPP